GFQLRLEPVGEGLLPFEDVLQEVPTPVVTPLAAQSDTPVETGDRLALELDREGQLFHSGLTSADGPQPLQVGVDFQVEDPLDQAVGIFHLLDRLVPKSVRQSLVAPVLVHLGVQVVLVHSSQLRGQNLVERLDYLVITKHWTLSLSTYRMRRS